MYHVNLFLWLILFIVIIIMSLILMGCGSDIQSVGASGGQGSVPQSLVLCAGGRREEVKVSRMEVTGGTVKV